MKTIGTLKFNKHGIRDTATGKYHPVFYSIQRRVSQPGLWLSVSAKTYRPLPAALQPENLSDISTDLFVRDAARFPAGSEIFEALKDFAPSYQLNATN